MGDRIINMVLGKVCPTITADFTVSHNPCNAYYTDVTFTSTSTGNPDSPDVFIWTWMEDGIHKSYIGSVMTTKINALGSIVMTLTAINSVSGASGQKSVTVTANAYLPITPVLWLDAMQGITLNGSNVSNWTDGTNNFTQNTAGNQPELITNFRNGKNSVYFNGTTSLMEGNDIELGTKSFTMFIVFAPNLKTTIDYFVRFGNFGVGRHMTINAWNNWRYMQHNPTTGASYTLISKVPQQFQILTFVKNFGTNVRMYWNKELTFTRTDAGVINAFDDGGVTFIGGVSSTNLSEFYLSEMIIHDSVLSDINRNLILDYLLTKHQIS